MRYICMIHFPSDTQEAFRQKFIEMMRQPYVKFIDAPGAHAKRSKKSPQMCIQWFESVDENVFETVSPYDYGYVSRMVHEQMSFIKVQLYECGEFEKIPNVGYTTQLVIGSGTLGALACKHNVPLSSISE